jgi:secreted protein with Ig-like and vWFA domain
MTLEQQLKNLIQEAPQYGVPSPIMENGVVPVLKSYGQKLRHDQYYLRQTKDDNLILTVLSSNQHPELEKKVIYAFPSSEDAAKFKDTNNTNIVAQVFPLGQILFQMFTMKDVDSIVFIDDIQDAKHSTEIHCRELQTAINQQLKLLLNNLPPNNIA